MNIADNTVTRLCYQYRDASNYKKHAYLYLNGRLEGNLLERVRSKLDEGLYFIPYDLRLDIPELQSQMLCFPSGDDHVYHELDLDGIEILMAAPDGAKAIPLNAFVAAFDAIRGSESWDVIAALSRLGLASPEVSAGPGTSPTVGNPVPVCGYSEMESRRH